MELKEMEWMRIVCPECGIPYVIPLWLLRKHQTFGGPRIFCPVGHATTWGINPVVHRLRKQISALKGQVTKLKRR